MSEQLDTKALRAHAHELREMHFDIDEGDDSLYVHGGADGGIYPVESLLRRNKDAIVALLNAAPLLLAAAEERDELSADWDDAHSALSEVCSATDQEHDLPLRLSEMAETVVRWLKTAQNERDALRAELTRTIVCPLCKGEFVGQTGHLCPSAQTVGARKDALVVVHPNGPKQPGQDAGAHRKLAERHLETIIERDALRARVADLEREVERVRGELKREKIGAPAILRRGTFITLDEMRAALAAQKSTPMDASPIFDVEPHIFIPLRLWDGWHDGGRCGSCYRPKWKHPTRYWAQARPLGDMRPACDIDPCDTPRSALTPSAPAHGGGGEA